MSNSGKNDPPRRRSDGDEPNSDMLRRDIDEGKTGDKIGFPDPAAAPLGTDAEAGGAPPTEEQLKIAREAETKRPDEKEASRNRPVSGGDKK